VDDFFGGLIGLVAVVCIFGSGPIYRWIDSRRDARQPALPPPGAQVNRAARLLQRISDQDELLPCLDEKTRVEVTKFLDDHQRQLEASYRTGDDALPEA
jgi:hypothetical protein